MESNQDTTETEGYWVRPDYWVEEAIASNDLIALKGVTPTELPALGKSNHGN